jgi:hypothetical protein
MQGGPNVVCEMGQYDYRNSTSTKPACKMLIKLNLAERKLEMFVAELVLKWNCV